MADGVAETRTVSTAPAMEALIEIAPETSAARIDGDHRISRAPGPSRGKFEIICDGSQLRHPRRPTARL